MATETAPPPACRYCDDSGIPDPDDWTESRFCGCDAGADAERLAVAERAADDYWTRGELALERYLDAAP